MPAITLYMGASLDGFIARRDGDVSWLDAFLAEGQDYGYSEFLQGIDVIVMGSRTFEQLPDLGPWPYGDIKTYVLTGRKLDIPEGARAVLYSGGLDDLVPMIRGESHKGIWLLGGGAVARSFLRHGSVDRIILSIIPVILGEGIPLFGETKEARLTLLETRSYRDGIVQMHYVVELISDIL